MGDDPTRDAWTSVGDQMKDLGGAFRERYDAGGDDDPATDEVKDALRTVGEGLDRLFTAIGRTVRDPDVQAKAKQTGASVIDAIGTTLGTIADEVRDVVGRRGSGGDGESPSGDDPVTEDAVRELDDADAVDEIRADLEDDEA